MKTIYLLGAAALALGTPALAQDNINLNDAASNSNAVSGSASGAQSDNNSRNTNNNGNAGIGNSDSVSVSDSTAVSGSVSGSESNGNQQGQSQGLDNRNSNAASNSAQNQQGVTVNQQWNSTNRKVTEFRTNAAVPLAASSSFSSDYCGGTASGGASVAPLGISIGGAAPTFDNSCRYLRVAEKAGMLGANYYNMRQPDMAGRAMSMMAWAVCMAGPQQDSRRKGLKDNVTMEACLALGLLGSEVSPAQPSQQPVTPLETQKPNVTPPTQYESTPVIQGELGYSTPNRSSTEVAASLPRMP